MASLNDVKLIGNLTRDIELRYTPQGNAVGSTAMAVNRKWKNDRGEPQEETTFVDLTLWGKTAEVCAQHVGKGSLILAIGRLKQESWQDKATGQNRSKLIVVAEGVQFLGAPRDGAGGQPQGQRRTAADSTREAQQRQARPQEQGPFQDAGNDDDIPF